MQSTENFTVNINGKKILCNKQMIKMSTFLNNLLFLGTNTFNFGLNDMTQNNEEQQIHIELLDEPTFMNFAHFCQLNNYKQPTVIKPLKQKDNLQSYLDQKNYHFIENFKILSPQFIALGKAAIFLGCQSLLRVVCAKFAALLYFDDTKKSYEAKCKELEISTDITVENVVRFLEYYQCMYS